MIRNEKKQKDSNKVRGGVLPRHEAVFSIARLAKDSGESENDARQTMVAAVRDGICFLHPDSPNPSTASSTETLRMWMAAAPGERPPWEN